MVVLPLFVILAIVLANAESYVHVLTDDNFDEVLKSHSPMLVEFYAPCKKLEPEYEEAAKILHTKESKVYLGKVDATADSTSQLQKRFTVQGFPTLKFMKTDFAGLKEEPYTGQREAEPIVQWLEKKLNGNYKMVTSKADLDQIQAENTLRNKDSWEKTTILGVFNTREEAAAFDQVSSSDDVKEFFAIINDPALAKEVSSAHSVPFVQVYRPFKPDQLEITNDAATIKDDNLLRKFVDDASLPHSDVKIFTNDNISQVMENGVFLVEFYAPWCKYCKTFVPEYEKVAQHFLTQVPSVVVGKLDCIANDASAQKHKIESYPTIVLFKDGLSVKYSNDWNSTTVIDFVRTKLQSSNKLSVANDEEEATLVNTYKESSNIIVACVPPSHHKLVDDLAFQDSSDSLRVVQRHCEEGKEKVTYYHQGQLLETLENGTLSNVADLRKWYKRALVPNAFLFQDEMLDLVTDAGIHLVFFYFLKDVDQATAQIKRYEKLGALPKYKDAAFAYVDSTDKYLMKFFTLNEDDLPVLRIIDMSNNDMAIFNIPNGEITEENIDAVLDQHDRGMLKKVDIPEVIPEDDEGTAYAEDHEDEGEPQEKQTHDEEEGEPRDLAGEEEENDDDDDVVEDGEVQPQDLYEEEQGDDQDAPAQEEEEEEELQQQEDEEETRDEL